VRLIYAFPRASPFFLNASHFVDQHGEANLALKVGLRNTLGLFDNLQLEFNKAMNNIRKTSVQFQLSLPYLNRRQDQLLLAYHAGNKTLIEDCEEQVERC